MTNPAEVLDASLEWLVLPSFTRVGPAVRRRLFAWRDVDTYDLTGHVVAITGATSGLGRAAATRLARNGAAVIVIGRDPNRTESIAGAIGRSTGNLDVVRVVADMGDLDAVRNAARTIVDDHGRLDVLIHNAGALLHQRTVSGSGREVTVASQVIGPFLLTDLLLDLLAATGPGRVITVSSGGMYTAPVTTSGLEMSEVRYDGTKQYAIAKRAQVTLTEMWAERVDPQAVVFHAMHPGWADTPGVAAALPTFRRVLGPLLRDADGGADTMVWLAADDAAPLASTGRFWLDRRPRPIHRLPSTRRSDTPERRAQLWQWVSEQAGSDRSHVGETGATP